MMQSYNDFIFALDQKMCIQIHFYSKIGLTHTFLFSLFIFYITPTDLQTIILYSFKVLLCIFIFIYRNEVIKRIKKNGTAAKV